MTTKGGSNKTAEVLARMEGQIGQLLREGAVRGEVLERVEAQVRLTNGRVSALEDWRVHVRGIVTATVIIVGALGWLATFFFK